MYTCIHIRNSDYRTDFIAYNIACLSVRENLYHVSSHHTESWLQFYGFSLTLSLSVSTIKATTTTTKTPSSQQKRVGAKAPLPPAISPTHIIHSIYFIYNPGVIYRLNVFWSNRFTFPINKICNLIVENPFAIYTFINERTHVHICVYVWYTLIIHSISWHSTA